ncbi:MAG: hypothetical protein HY914_12440 [Desulfomonile tiedjei]|nr:hypothetical protein [Desulfomonile tiedjei]
MKIKLLVVAIILTMTCPAHSHAFGLLRYLYDGFANQFGLDRGPIPKMIPTGPPLGFKPCATRSPIHPDAHRIHIQAEGFLNSAGCP